MELLAWKLVELWLFFVLIQIMVLNFWIVLSFYMCFRLFFFCLDFQKTFKSNRWKLRCPSMVVCQLDIGSPSGQSPIGLDCSSEIQTEKMNSWYLPNSRVWMKKSRFSFILCVHWIIIKSIISDIKKVFSVVLKIDIYSILHAHL